MRYVIVDDNETDRLTIEAMAAKHADMQLAAAFEHPLEAAAFIRESAPELLFLDVEMPLMNGPDFLRSIVHPPPCIFITSHPDYAVEAFELYAIDYILKPLRQERFDAAIARVQAYLAIHRKAIQYEHLVERDTIIIHEGYDTHKVLLSDIIYLEALKDYTRIFTTSRSYITLGSIGTIVESLNINHIRRVHRSYAVHAGKINSFQDNSIMVGNINIPVGKTFRKDITALRKDYF